MKKQLLALAALAAVSGVATAQNATVYGVLDTNISINTGSSSGSSQSFNAGGLTPNIFGFKGTEDLGGGLKAGFNLEGHFAPQNGQSGLYDPTSALSGTQGGKLNTNLFARQANLTLSNSVGTLTLGNQYSAGVLAMAATDPRGLRESGSGLAGWLLPSLTATTLNSVGGVFINNAIGVSSNLAGATVSGTYALGGQAGNTSKKQLISAGIVLPIQNVTLSSGYLQAKDANGTNDAQRIISYGASTKLGQATVAVNYISNKIDNTDNYTMTGFGGSYPVSSALSVNAAYYRSKLDSDTTNNIVLGAEYGLSKRTTTYVQYFNSSNRGAGALNFAATYGAAGSTSATQVGIRHTF